MLYTVRRCHYGSSNLLAFRRRNKMSNLLTVFDGFDKLNRTALGFERLFDDMLRVNNVQVQQSYPPYNIIRNSDTEYAIEIAVGGFSDEDIDITLKEGQLVVTGEIKTEDTKDYMYRGIASRKFIRTFSLADNVEIKKATLKNGLLNISLEYHIPEEQKPKKIAIAKS